MITLLRLILLLTFAVPASAETIRVGAAISLREALGEVAAAYHTATGHHVEFVFASSGQVSAQIASGAAIDLFISAANQQVDQLIDAKLADPATRQVIAGNRIVLIAPADAKHPPNGFAALADAAVRRIAIGEPKTVPAGRYAEQVLAAAGLAEAVADKLVYGKNVRQVLAYVERGEVSAAIVYSTDARQSGDKVRIVAQADEKTHDPVVYPSIVVTASSKPAAARQFQNYLIHSEQARSVLTNKGFSIPPNNDQRQRTSE